MAHVPQRLFAAFGIVIDAPADEEAHFLIVKNEVREAYSKLTPNLSRVRSTLPVVEVCNKNLIRSPNSPAQTRMG